MVSLRTAILACSILLVAAAAVTYLNDAAKEKTLADDITLLERQAAANPPPAEVVRECNRRMANITQAFGVGEGMPVAYDDAEGEVVLVAVVGDYLECEKTVRVENSVLVYKRVGRPTIWVRMDSDVLDELYALSQGNHSRRELADKVMEEVSAGRIRVHPYERVADLVVDASGGKV